MSGEDVTCSWSEKAKRSTLYQKLNVWKSFTPKSCQRGEKERKIYIDEGGRPREVSRDGYGEEKRRQASNAKRRERENKKKGTCSRKGKTELVTDLYRDMLAPVVFTFRAVQRQCVRPRGRVRDTNTHAS